MITFAPGDKFPDIQVSTKDGEETSIIPRTSDLSGEKTQSPWYAIFIYRGHHCPICASYLNKLQQHLSSFKELKTRIVAVSADSVEQLNQFYRDEIGAVDFPVYAELKIDVMENMGLYLSKPLSSNETDHIFAEPALIVVNGEREIQIIEKASAPFIRPEIKQLLGGIKHIQKSDYPIRGTHQY
jgi:peroxiredoxin